jgi:predicted glycoside hydrolase/deacetylase ChbG (UPF0249 family)
MIIVKLKDGTILRCSIYETGRSGEYPILNHERINYLFNRRGLHDVIYFQTEMINGKFYPANVVEYTIEM